LSAVQYVSGGSSSVWVMNRVFLRKCSTRLQPAAESMTNRFLPAVLMYLRDQITPRLSQSENGHVRMLVFCICNVNYPSCGQPSERLRVKLRYDRQWEPDLWLKIIPWRHRLANLSIRQSVGHRNKSHSALAYIR
jgi:hypothetical protein